jgi:predicted ferric reductase
MGLWLNAASAATVVNILLLVLLVGIWARNYREFRSKHTLGFVVFGLLLLAENLLSFNYYVLDPQVASHLAAADSIAGRAMMTVQILELGAVVFLTWITWD